LFLIPEQLFERISGQSESLFGLRPNLEQYCPIIVWEIEAGFWVV